MPTENTQAVIARIEHGLWLSDGGLETTLIFHDGIDLPHFASFPLLAQEAGRQALTRYFGRYLAEARRLGAGFLMDTATWRAGAGWGAIMGLSPEEIDAVNREAVAFARGLASKTEARGIDILLNGVIGPHGDAYAPDRLLDAHEAQDVHARQVRVLAAAGVDLVTAMTIPSVEQGIGIVRAARAADVPVAISFTVETDGRLIDGRTLAEAIAGTDAATGAYAAWYGINCAHPDHFRGTLVGDWVGRVRMVRANASRKSHAELDGSTELDAGDPADLARGYGDLMQLLPCLRILGGCCGTDNRHIGAIGQRCMHAA